VGLDASSKDLIIKDIEADFDYAFKHGILKLPTEAKFGVTWHIAIILVCLKN